MDGGSWAELSGLAACWEGAVLALPLAHLPPGEVLLALLCAWGSHSGLG